MIEFVLTHFASWGDPIAVLLGLAAVAAFFYLPVVGRHVAVGLMVAAGAAIFQHHAYLAGVESERIAWEQKVAKEHARREDELANSSAEREQLAAQLSEIRGQNQALLQEIDLASHANDDRVCLDVDGVRRLQAIGRGR